MATDLTDIIYCKTWALGCPAALHSEQAFHSHLHFDTTRVATGLQENVLSIEPVVKQTKISEFAKQVCQRAKWINETI